MTNDASEISRQLATRVEALTDALAAGRVVQRSRGQIRLGNRGSLAVELHPPAAGVWMNHESGEGGDALDLVRHLRGGDKRDAIAWARNWLSLPISEPRPGASVSRAPAVKAARDLWAAVWRDSRQPASSPVQTYLASRGLNLPPDAPIRFHSACPRGSDKLPAMLALMTDPVTNQPTGIHRTFLKADGCGKAIVEGPVKMMMGAAGVIRLVPDEEVTLGLGIAEGIETALAIMQHTGWRPIWAAGSAGGIARFPVLPGIETLNIFADCDDAGAGLLAARTCAGRWHSADREATVQQPPVGTDWLDALGRAG